MGYQLYQGIIQEYTSATTCNVMQVPENYMMTDVRLPITLQNQTKPLKGSVVFVATEDGYKAFILSVLREPIEFLNTQGGMRAGSATTAKFLQPGELFFESRGNSAFPGLGATFYLSNAGTATIYSGQRQEFLTIGGRVTDDDHEVVLQGDNGFFQSTVNPLTNIRCSINFDHLNNLQIANNIVVSTSPVLVEKPLSELKFDSLGTVTLRSTTLGVTKGQFAIDIAGNVTLSSTLNVNLSATANLNLSATVNIDLSATALTTISGQLVKLNNGTPVTKGVARLSDLTTSNVTVDPTFWAFWSALPAQIAALPTTALDGGATLKAGLAALFGTAPTVLTSKISTASTTVSAGD